MTLQGLTTLVVHLENGNPGLTINGATIMLADEFPEMGFLSPKSLGGARSPVRPDAGPLRL